MANTKISADTITDAQINELARRPGSSLQTKAWCLAAMRVTYNNSPKQLADRRKARARVAAILNKAGG